MNPELTILRTLRPNYPRGLREPVLNAELPNYGEGQSLTDMRRHCEDLESRGHVVIIKATDFTLIKITPEGLARLAE
jgi:hypothetical protein